jgi:arsenite-transporting ATPase
VRTLLFTGPGGAGTSTLAASAALGAARAGRRTLLLTRQPVGVPLTGAGRLEVAVVDGRTAVESVWDGAAAALGTALPQLRVAPASSALPLPGSAELALFAALGRADADLVVVDAGPLEAAAALVALPATLRWWLDQLLPPGVRALGAVRTAAVSSGAARRGPVDALLGAVPAVERLLAADRLADPAETAVAVVALPRAASVPALRTAATALGLHGLRAGAVLTRTVPDDGPGEWWARRRAEQDAVLAALADVAPVHRVAECPVAPRDADELAALLDGWAPPAQGGPAAPAAERRDGAWRLSVPLPFAERADVDLARWGDDLVVTTTGTRRCLRLDALLRRCEVTGGRLADPGTAHARLEVSFRPDPQLWPAELLAAEERTP